MEDSVAVIRKQDLDRRANLEALMQHLRTENNARADEAIRAAAHPARADLTTDDKKKSA